MIIYNVTINIEESIAKICVGCRKHIFLSHEYWNVCVGKDTRVMVEEQMGGLHTRFNIHAKANLN